MLHLKFNQENPLGFTTGQTSEVMNYPSKLPTKNSKRSPLGLNTLGRWSRRAWWLHAMLIVHLTLLPAPQIWPSWTDSDSDGSMDSFHDTVTNQSYTLAQLDDIAYDIDGDGASNEEELQYGSNPFVYDTDGDGLNDGDEIHLAIQQSEKNYSLTQWDSDGDGVSDHDDFNGFYGVTYPFGGELGNYPGSSYSDYDGDGIKNPNDPFPFDPSNNDLDGDGIDDSADPDSTSSDNTSYLNNESWGAAALADADFDGVANFWDPYPYDRSNYSSSNNLYWYSNVFGDDDSDGSLNFEDTYPFDSENNAGSGVNDSDGDGIEDGLDPSPDDSENYSETNGISWQGYAIGDDDGDEILNFWDPYPADAANYSDANAYYWYTEVLDDADGDGIPNYQDTTPYGDDPGGGDPGGEDPGGGDPGGGNDSDADGIADEDDPAPGDASNYSSINGNYWYTDVLGDADGDGTLNYWDESPYGEDPGGGDPGNNDSDGDGIPDSYDPEPYDSSNYSYYNQISWYEMALNDDDEDGIENYSDPFPSDFSNYSSANQVEWYDNVFGDEDGDGVLNYEDGDPHPPPPPDEDQDGLNADEEQDWGTSDSNVDSDGDGLTDYEEVHTYGSHPADAYSISRSNGWGELYPDWQLVDGSDFDGDGLPDQIEVHYNLNWDWPGDALLDLDNDGINNITQYNAGIALNANLVRYDADDDGMTDVFEDHYSLNKNWAGDAVLDADQDGVTNHEESVLLLNPLVVDSVQIGGLGDLHWLMLAVRYPNGETPPMEDVNSNGIPDWQDALLASGPSAPDYWHFSRVSIGDLDGDGLPDEWEHSFGLWKHPNNGLLLRKQDAEQDNDGDGLTNSQEYLLGTSPVAGDSNGNGISDGDEDADGDGLSNMQEYLLGSSPLLADTDGDGVNDYQEMQEGTDLLDANSNARLMLGLSINTRIE